MIPSHFQSCPHCPQPAGPWVNLSGHGCCWYHSGQSCSIVSPLHKMRCMWYSRSVCGHHAATRQSPVVHTFCRSGPHLLVLSALVLLVVLVPSQVLRCLLFLNLLIIRNKWQTTASSFILRDNWGSRPYATEEQLIPALGRVGCISCFRFGSNVNSPVSPPCPPLKWPLPVTPTSFYSALGDTNTTGNYLVCLPSVHSSCPQDRSCMKAETSQSMFCLQLYLLCLELCVAHSKYTINAEWMQTKVPQIIQKAIINTCP